MKYSLSGTGRNVLVKNLICNRKYYHTNVKNAVKTFNWERMSAFLLSATKRMNVQLFQRAEAMKFILLSITRNVHKAGCPLDFQTREIQGWLPSIPCLKSETWVTRGFYHSVIVLIELYT